MKLLYACADSASDPLLWSGTVLNCRRALEAAGATVETIDNIPFECPPHVRLLHQLYKRFTRKTHFIQIEPTLLRRAARRIETRFARGDCDAVFSPGTGVPVYAFLPPSIPVFSYLDATKATWIKTYFGMDTLCARSRRHVGEVDRTSLHNNTTTFFSSEWAVEEARRDYHVSDTRMSVVPFGANLVDPPSRSEVEGWVDARRPDQVNLFFLGKEWERKGGPEALQLVRELRARGINASIDIVGCTPPALTEEEKGMVRLHGFINHSQPEGRARFRELLRNAHVLLFLSRAEAFGIALCEAAAFGVPAYARNTGGIPTIIRPGQNGWLSDTPLNVASAAQEIQSVLTSPGAYRRLALGARDDYENRLNWRAAGDTMVHVMKTKLSR